jgi:hypothetical protein
VVLCVKDEGRGSLREFALLFRLQLGEGADLGFGGGHDRTNWSNLRPLHLFQREPEGDHS